MDDNTVVMIAVVSRVILVLISIVGAIYLMIHNEKRWVWLIFLSIILSSFSLKKCDSKTKTDSNVEYGIKNEIQNKNITNP